MATLVTLNLLANLWLHGRDPEMDIHGAETTRPVKWDDDGEVFSDEDELTL